MAVSEQGDFWPHLLSGGVGTALGVVGTIVLAFVNRQPAMSALVDARIKMLIESYEARAQVYDEREAAYEAEIAGLRQRIRSLEDKIDRLTCSLCDGSPAKALLFERAHKDPD